MLCQLLCLYCNEKTIVVCNVYWHIQGCLFNKAMQKVEVLTSFFQVQNYIVFYQYSLYTSHRPLNNSTQRGDSRAKHKHLMPFCMLQDIHSRAVTPHRHMSLTDSLAGVPALHKGCNFFGDMLLLQISFTIRI